MKNKVILIAIFLTACTQNVRFLGHHSPSLIAKKVQVGYTKSTVDSVFGRPSFISNDGNTWYYVRIDGRIGSLVSFVPESREITELKFENNTISAIKNYKNPIDDNDDPALDYKKFTAYKKLV